MLCAGVAAQGLTRGLKFFVWNFAWDRLASLLYAATATPFRTWRYQLIIRYCWCILTTFGTDYTPRFNEVERGYTGITLSVCPSVDRIVSALYLQQYTSDPFHICTSYQATSEGVSRVISVSIFKNAKFWRIFKFVTLTLSSFDLGSNMTEWYG